MKRTVALLMENQPGALSRVVGLFSQRGYNIESLIVAATEDPTLSRLTMTTSGDQKVIEQITKQLNKLIDVVKVLDLGESDYVERELLLVKFLHGSINTEVIKELNGEIIFENNELLNIQFVGTSKELDQVLKDLESSNPLEIVRTGASGISSNLKTLTI
ncbi:acetolactate synthase small subunit [Gammaproteobacteria bacterium]|jgi:acetolactate synthase I/III small subunit|nr:acetolactate synthase small subunit [Gammaproteobacteria bacterium]